MTQKLSTLASVALDNDCRIVFEAIDATTGNAVTGVLVSAISIYATDLAPGASSPPDDTTPLWLPLPTETGDGGPV